MLLLFICLDPKTTFTLLYNLKFAISQLQKAKITTFLHSLEAASPLSLAAICSQS